MKRKKKQNKQTKVSPIDTFKSMDPQKKRRFLLKSGAAVLVAGFGGGAVMAYDKNRRELHDLSSIVNGSPVVVQIHDPNCPTCRCLKSRSLTALEGLDGVQFRLADIFTPEGKAIQRKYGVQTITLLLFDGEGKHIQTIVGLQELDQLKAVFEDAFKSQLS